MTNKIFIFLASLSIISCEEKEKLPTAPIESSGDGGTEESSSDETSGDICTRTMIFVNEEGMPQNVEIVRVRYGFMVGEAETWQKASDPICDFGVCEVSCFSEDLPGVEPLHLQVVFDCGMGDVYKSWNLVEQRNGPYIALACLDNVDETTSTDTTTGSEDSTESSGSSDSTDSSQSETSSESSG